MPKIGFPGIATPTLSYPTFNLNPSVLGLGTNLNKWGWLPISLPAGNTYLFPAGNYAVNIGLSTFLQYFDSNAGYWRNVSTGPAIEQVLGCDGANYRLANCTGSPMAGLITNAGSGLTNGFNTVTVTPNAGGSTWKTVVGGANATITVTTAGTSYTIPPMLFVDPPPPGGIQATATCTISAGAVNAASFTNVGAGYTSVPAITVVNAPGDTTGNGAVLTASALTGSGTLTAMIALGLNTTAQTAVTTFTFTPASTIAATAVMCFAATSGGPPATSGLSNAANGSITYITSGPTAGASVLVNPAINIGIFQPRNGYCAPQTAAGNLTIVDPGVHQVVPTYVCAVTSNGTISAATTFTGTAVGGLIDQSFILQLPS